MFKKRVYIFVAIAATAALFNSLQLISVNAKDDNQKTIEESSTLKNIIPDSTITASIKAQYLADEKIKGLDVHVETINGKVTLTGKVPNIEVKDQVISIAKNSNGVKEVVSKLEIK